MPSSRVATRRCPLLRALKLVVAGAQDFFALGATRRCPLLRALKQPHQSPQDPQGREGHETLPVTEGIETRKFCCVYTSRTLPATRRCPLLRALKQVRNFISLRKI